MFYFKICSDQHSTMMVRLELDVITRVVYMTMPGIIKAKIESQVPNTS